MSLKKHADVIAGRQTNQTLTEITKIFMNKYLYPPCKNSLATSCAKSVMVSSEGKLAVMFTEGVSSAAEGNWQLMRLHQRSAYPQMFVLYPSGCGRGRKRGVSRSVCGSSEW